ncbi:phenylacetate--CoA ligase family protein [Peribacillus frigoritolerans]|uniref:hypothetical protein n=1 Tax=Peribacillus frigoritolerans TaxID=450367 RepID=UPI0037FF2F13
MISSTLSKIREVAFWSLDYIKGEIVKNAYQEIKKINEMDSRDERLLRHQKTSFNNLAIHAITSTEYYKDIKGKNLLEFPVVNKNIIRDYQNDFLSKKYNKDQLITMSTSGSTGTPFVCFQNVEKKRRVNAEVIYYSEKAGYSVGESLIFLRAITDKSQKSKFHQWIQNETLIDISNLNELSIENVLLKIEKASNTGSMMLAYASTFDAFKDYFSRNGVKKTEKYNIAGIISSSEILFDDTRDAMANVFNCQVFSRYSNQENGIIGQDDEQNNVFILNEANYIIEILKINEDKPVPEGELGRIVITDLYNYAMPMIRYDTGDIGSIMYIEKNRLNKKAISNFAGRMIDVVFDCYGNRLSPHIITNNFWSFPEIKQYQFIQETRTHYTVKINVEDVFEREKELRDILLTLLGAKATITIELSDEIPVTSSGKRKYVVNKMNG